ncbi:MAG: LysM peptidoglycan-binding domain-containing protein [Candidatus Omnitrophota bacterium]|nr:LysM peptidoglycan-binding domain-containing protein [Candidatus Omnitrophota bacterium]
MDKQKLLYTAVLFLTIVISGCAVRTYSLTRNRVDQGLGEGNRGYLMGRPTMDGAKERKITRTTQIVEIEIGSPLKFQKLKPQYEKTTPRQEVEELLIEEAVQEVPEFTKFEKYIVQKNDTLQKISQKFYGTAKKWHKIYNANKDTLKGPDKIYPGKELKIPVQEDSQAPKNLK